MIKQENIKEEPSPLSPPKSTDFACSICSEIFASHSLLVKHFVKHGNNEIDLRGRPRSSKRSDPISLQCEWCPERLPTHSKAIQHKYRKHKKEANHFCKFCGKLFPIKVTLDQHMRAEHNVLETTPGYVIDMNIECGYCNSKFQSEHALKCHLNTAHLFDQQHQKHVFIPAPSKKIKFSAIGELISIYYCHLCGSEYVVKYNLRKHIESHSVKERDTIPENFIKCTVCDAIFYSKKAYDVHNGNHKPDDLYVTSEEERKSLVARVDQDFDIRRVPTTIDTVLSRLGPVRTSGRIRKERIKTEISEILDNLKTE